MKKEYDFSTSVPNRHLKAIKKGVHIRLDQDILDWLKARALKEGLGYQTLTNALLRQVMSNTNTAKEKPSEKFIRRIVREELKKSRAGNE